MFNCFHISLFTAFFSNETVAIFTVIKVRSSYPYTPKAGLETINPELTDKTNQSHCAKGEMVQTTGLTNTRQYKYAHNTSHPTVHGWTAGGIVILGIER